MKVIVCPTSQVEYHNETDFIDLIANSFDELNGWFLFKIQHLNLKHTNYTDFRCSVKLCVREKSNTLKLETS